MIIDGYRDLPGFPFSQYFEEIEQYTNAQLYWLAVLRSVNDFRESEWRTRPRPVDLEDDMYMGVVTKLQSIELRKEMTLNTRSLAGDINMAIRENGPMDEEHILPGMELTPEQRDQILNGIPEDKLRRDATASYTPHLIWVEKATIWVDKPGDPMGGTEVPVERLIFNCEISDEMEPLARRALASFLAPGTAMDRVNDEFAQPDE
jgi:hypothetical protein